MEYLDLHKKKKGLVLYDKMEKIPVRDHLYMAYDNNFNRTLFQKGKLFHFFPDLFNLSLTEKVIFSSLIFVNNSKRLWHYIFGKKEKLVITTE